MAVSKTQNERPAILELIDLANQLKFGITVEITVPANDSYSGSYVFDEPFDANSKCFVFLGFADTLSQNTLTLTLVDSSYSGFSYSVSNAGTDPATVTVGYMAIAAIPLS